MEEVVDEVYEAVEELIEVVAETEEALDDNAVAGPRIKIGKRYLRREAAQWWLLPDSIEALEKLVQRWGRYAQCLVELRWELRKRGLLYPELERDLAREINAERAKLYLVGLKALELAGSCSSITSEDLRKLCEYAAIGPPRYIWEIITRGSRGAKRPDIIMAYMCRLKSNCC